MLESQSIIQLINNLSTQLIDFLYMLYKKDNLSRCIQKESEYLNKHNSNIKGILD